MLIYLNLIKYIFIKADGTETIAIKQPGDNNHYKLYGYKWFSSATDSDMTITLARIVDENKNVIKKPKI